MKLVINIPCYNEEKTLPLVLNELPKEIKGISEIEVQIVDDGSTDKTAEVARKYGVTVVRHKHNRGLGVAFKTGINAALKSGADIIVTIDADGQFDAGDIPKLVKPIQDGECDVVTCSRFLPESVVIDMPYIKKLGNFGFTALINKLTGSKFTDTQCGFRSYSREAALRMNLKGGFTYTQESFLDLVEKGMQIKEIPSRVKYFKTRKSHISGKLVKYGLRSLKIIMKAVRDIHPLTFFGAPGFTILLFGFIGALYSFIYYITHLMTGKIKMLFSVSVFLMIFGLSLVIIALLADMLKRVTSNQEEILFRLKKQEYKRTDHND
jgi:glycosyltransferase involved in cell wall biosynthesis